MDKVGKMEDSEIRAFINNVDKAYEEDEKKAEKVEAYRKKYATIKDSDLNRTFTI